MLTGQVTDLLWWNTYKLVLALLLLLLLLLIVGYLFWIDRRYSKQVLSKFLLAEQPLSSLFSSTVNFPAKESFAAKVALVCGMLLLLALLINTYQLYENQTWVKAFAVSLFLVNLFGSYYLGSLSRNHQIESLVNRLYEQIISRDTAQEKLLKGELRLQQQNETLAKLAGIQHRGGQPLEEFVRNLIAEAAKTLKVGRVSVWLYSEDKKTLVCEALYQSDTMQYSRGMRLEAAHLPSYFSALTEHRVLCVNDTYHHPTTAEFVSDYLPSHGIGALLDATIWLSDELVGVLCHEHLGGAREWTMDERNFAGSMADLIRIALESSKRVLAEADLQYQRKHLETLVRVRTASIESNAKLSRFLVERAPVSILYMNIANEIIEMNPEAERVFGYKREDAIGKTYYELFTTPETKAYQKALFQRVAYGEKVQGHEISIRCADGHMMDISVSRSMEVDADGNPVIISIGQDMSQQKALEASLVRAREAAESADRIKSMFVASMSHELRTPLNSIIGFLGVVLQGMSGTINEVQKDQLGRAYQSARHLLALISDVIDISKIEAGFLQVHVESFELKPLLLEIESSLHHLVAEKHLELVVECDAGVQLKSDRKRLYQVILNVASNAVKYTERGWVKVTATATLEMLTITVQDTGIGMDEAGQAKIFKPFERVESRLKIKTLGTGLGLYLTHKILTQLLKGNITVQSQPEMGSVFTITVPLVLMVSDATSVSVSVLESDLP